MFGALLAVGLIAGEATPLQSRPATAWSPAGAELAFGPTALGAPSGQAAAYSTHPHGPGRRVPTREDRLGEPVMPSGPTETPRSVVGIASTYGPGWDGWIAWPGGPGWRLRVCGPARCVVIVTTDAGPDRAMQRAGRVVDLDVATFERIAGAPWTIGLTKVTVTVLGRTGARPS